MNEMVPRGEPFLLPRLKAALARAGGTHDWEHVIARIASGYAQYWEAPNGRGALVTEVIPFPKLISVNYWLAAGDLRACMELVPHVEAWAKAQGVTRATGMGRPGFSQILGPTGVTIAGLSYRKEL